LAGRFDRLPGSFFGGWTTRPARDDEGDGNCSRSGEDNNVYNRFHDPEA